MIRILNDWDTFVVPEKSGLTSIRQDAWENITRALYCIAVWGLSLQSEISEKVGIQSPSRKNFELYNRLVNDGWVEQSIVSMVGKYWKVGMVRLTPMGKSICEQWRWKIVESDWEKMLANHQGEEQERHTASVLIFAHYARLCGYKTVITPQLEKTFFEPDILIEKDGEKVYVEVEVTRKGLSSRTGQMEWLRKWIHQYSYQNKIAFCTLSANKRINLVQKLKRRWPGTATDLTTLRKVCKQPDPQLWINKWSWEL